MIVNIINILQSSEYYGAGDNVEIAKGKFEYVSTWKGFKRKVRRQWQSKR